MFDVYFGNKRGKKDYDQLDPKLKERIDEFCERIKTVPVPFKEYDIRKIEGKSNTFRARFGKFRVSYYVDELGHRVYLLKIEKRDETTYKF